MRKDVCRITAWTACSALGCSAREMAANLRQRADLALTCLADDVPGRKVLFGGVSAALPEIRDPEYATRTNRLLLFALEGARGAFEKLVSKYGASRVAVVLGSSNTGIDEAQRHIARWHATGKSPGAMRFSEIELGTPAEFLAREVGVTGLHYVLSTACSSSAKVFPAARRLLETGLADAVIAGGADGRCRFALNGFHALGALSAGRCRPFAPDRDGITLGEGAALFALEKGVPQPGEVCFAGAGETSDAYHPTAPDPEGGGAFEAMRQALDAAGLAPEEVGYVNTHGTGTRANDDMERHALKRLFGARMPETLARGSARGPSGLLVESTKALTGHALGAAGALEAAICLSRLASGEIRGAALSNSFAFGGSNVALVFARCGTSAHA